MAVLEQMVFFLVILVLIKIYSVYTKGICTCEDRLDGKSVLLTGGNSGIGYWTALDLAKRGARLIITSENEKDIQRARDEIIKLSGNENVIAKHLDFMSLEGTRRFAEDMYKTEEKLDVLINNAGTYGLGNKYSKDGLLKTLQINYFGPFLLTHLLIDLLKKGKSARIVSLASSLSQVSLLDLSDINKCPGPVFSDTLVYGNSKLFVVYMTWEFAARLKEQGITVNCLHPGAVHTAIFYKKSNSWQAMVARICGKTYFKTPQEGAQTSIHLAVSDKVANVTGYFYQDCYPYRPLIKKDWKNIRGVWEQSLKLVNLRPEEIKV